MPGPLTRPMGRAWGPVWLEISQVLLELPVPPAEQQPHGGFRCSTCLLVHTDGTAGTIHAREAQTQGGMGL